MIDYSLECQAELHPDFRNLLFFKFIYNKCLFLIKTQPKHNKQSEKKFKPARNLFWFALFWFALASSRVCVKTDSVSQTLNATVSLSSAGQLLLGEFSMG